MREISRQIGLGLISRLLGTSMPYIVLNVVIILALLFLLLRFVLIPLSSIPSGIIIHKRLSKKARVLLELTPPMSSFKTTHATAQLFNAIHSIAATRSFTDAILGRKKILSFELVANRKEGIRYIVQLPKDDVFNFKQQIVSYLPEIKFKIVKDYLKDLADKPVRVVEFKQARHFAFPLADSDKLSEHDPIAYLISSMAKPETEEIIAYQLVVSAASSREAIKVQSKLSAGKDAGLNSSIWTLPFRAVFKVLAILVSVTRFILVIFGEKLPVVRSSSVGQTNGKSVAGIHLKLSEPLFDVDIRMLAQSDNPKRLQGMTNTLESYHVPGHQGLIMRSSFPSKFKIPYRINAFNNRLPSMFSFNPSVLSSSELAAIYHFPYGEHGRGEDMASSLSRTLPTPIGMKADADDGNFDVVLGKNVHHGEETAIGLTAGERERHVYIIGGTGNGKTTMLQYAIMQDIKAGKGIALIDPHGDLAETVLRHIPKNRINDVIYFNPSDISFPIGLNLLEQPEGLSKDELLIEQDFITESIVSVFRKIFSDDDSGGHRIEHFLRNAIHTAFTVEDATLFTVYKLLTNNAFRRTVVNELNDEDLINFWKGEFNNAGDYQKVKMSSGVNAKLGRFSRSAVTRRILEQPKSTIDFDDIIQNKKILICNFSKGQIGEDTSALLGISVPTKLQLSALRRSRLSQDIRTPFYLYVDEFQNFATSSFAQLLSEARKYKLFLTMAEQTTAQQQDHRLTEVILANVGTVVCFRTGSMVDERLIHPLFSPWISEGEISNLPAYNFYARLMAVRARQPLSGETLLLDGRSQDDIAEEVIEYSRKHYAKEYRVVVKTKNKKAPIKNLSVNNQTTPIGS